MPTFLENNFRRNGFKEVEIWNTGVPGYNMYDYENYLFEYLLPFHPDMILFQIYSNDNINTNMANSIRDKITGIFNVGMFWEFYRQSFTEDNDLFF